MYRKLLGIAAFLWVGYGGPARALPLEFLPAGSPMYQELEALSGAGLLDSLAVFTRPLSLHDVAAALLRAERLQPSVGANVSFQRLMREVARERRDLGDSTAVSLPKTLLERGRGNSKIRLSLDGRLYGDFDDHREAAHFRLRDRSAAILNGAVQFSDGLGAYEELGFTRIRGQRVFIDPIVNHTDLELSVLRAGLLAASGPVHASLGYDSYRWGPGRRGTLLLSDAAGPFTSLLLRGSFGNITASAMSGILSRGEEKAVSAHRIEAAVTNRLTIGLGEAVRYPSSGIDLLYAIGLLPYAVVERIHIRDASTDSLRGAERANIMASVDVTARLGSGFTTYGEFLIDDLATEDRTMPDRIAYQLGLRADRPLFGAGVHARAEYTRVRRFTYATYYGQNFTYRDRPMGFALGPDVEAIWAEGSVDLSRDWAARSTLEQARKGEGDLGEAWDPSLGFLANEGLSGTVERRREWWADVAWLPREHASFSLGVGLRDVRNREHVPGANETSVLARFALEARY